MNIKDNREPIDVSHPILSGIEDGMAFSFIKDGDKPSFSEKGDFFMKCDRDTFVHIKTGRHVQSSLKEYALFPVHTYPNAALVINYIGVLND